METQNLEELPHLPEGWVWTNVGDISTKIHYGYTAKSTNEPIGPKMLRITDIQNRTVNWEDVPFCQIEDEKKSKYLLKHGDLVFARTGATVGKSFLVKGKIPEAVFASYLIRIILSSNIKRDYVYYFFQSLMYWLQIYEGQIGIGQPNINSSKLSKLFLPLSPLNEQNRIVVKIDELFTRLDAGVESLNKVKVQLQRYRQAILKYAFEGKLTEKWRNIHREDIESASVLLERIKEERKKKGKYKELQLIDTTELSELPDGWVWTRLGDIIFLSKERFNPTISKNERFIGLKHIASNTGRLLGFGKSADTRSTKTRFRKGDLLYGRLRPYLNKVWVAEFDGVCSTDILVLLKNNFVNNRYLSKMLLNNDFVKYTTQHMTGVQHPRINIHSLSKYILSLPSLLEQDTLSEVIDQKFSGADEIDKVVGNSLMQSEWLRQSILKEAFEGRLVPQDPTDEPAEKLLQRIRER